jgi:hypothetical protein
MTILSRGSDAGAIRVITEIRISNVPIDSGIGYFGRAFASSESQRVLAPLGRWLGSSAPWLALSTSMLRSNY